MDKILLYGGLSGIILFGMISMFLFIKLNIFYSIKVVFKLGSKSFTRLNNKKKINILEIREGKTTFHLQTEQATQPLDRENTVLLDINNIIIFDEEYLCSGEIIE